MTTVTFQSSGSITSLLAWRVGGSSSHIRSEAIGPETRTEIKPVLSVEEYRDILKDDVSTGEQITNRVAFLEAFCRGIIRGILKSYVQNHHKN